MKAVVLLSGGQDSTTCLFWALAKYNEVHAVIVDYGQKHNIEIDSAIKIANSAGVSHQVIDLNFFKQIGNSALLDPSKDVSETHEGNRALPASFVPGRNLIFITVAAMVAYKIGANRIVTGVCQTDYSGYPDCRSDTIKALNKAVVLGMEFPIAVNTPLMYLNKKQTVELAISLPGCMKAMEYSHTCYNGKWPPCLKCPSCVLRAKGFMEANVEDPIMERWRRETKKD